MSYWTPSNQTTSRCFSVPLTTVCRPFGQPGGADRESWVRFPVQGLSEFTCSPRVCVGSTRVVSTQCATHIVSILISCIDTALRWTGDLSRRPAGTGCSHPCDIDRKWRWVMDGWMLPLRWQISSLTTRHGTWWSHSVCHAGNIVTVEYWQWMEGMVPVLGARPLRFLCLPELLQCDKFSPNEKRRRQLVELAGWMNKGNLISPSVFIEQMMLCPVWLFVW